MRRRFVTFPINSLDVPRFVGIPTFMRLPQRADAEGTDVAVIGMPSDNGSPFRTGARFGPNAIRSMSAMLRPISPYRDGMDVFRMLECVDLGDTPVVPGYMPATLEAIQLFFDRVVSSGAVTIGLGGDHGCSIAELRSLAKHYGPVSVLHFDSHSDMVTPEAYLIDDLGADSLDTVELVMAFEEAFGVEIPEDAAEKISTVKEARMEKQKAA